MARRLRVEVEGGLYHVIARGERPAGMCLIPVTVAGNFAHRCRCGRAFAGTAELHTSNIIRRRGAAKQKAETDSRPAFAIDQAAKEYHARIAESQG